MAKKKKKKGMFSKLTSKGIILTIQLIASAVFLGYIYVLKMLPTRYYAILIIVLIALLLLEMIWITSGARRKRRTGKGFRIFISKFVSVALSALLIVGSVYASQGNSFLSNITSAFTQTRVIAVYAMKQGKINKVEDLKGKTIGVENKTSVSSITDALAQVQEKIGKEKLQ